MSSGTPEQHPFNVYLYYLWQVWQRDAGLHIWLKLIACCTGSSGNSGQPLVKGWKAEGASMAVLYNTTHETVMPIRPERSKGERGCGVGQH